MNKLNSEKNIIIAVGAVILIVSQFLILAKGSYIAGSVLFAVSAAIFVMLFSGVYESMKVWMAAVFEKLRKKPESQMKPSARPLITRKIEKKEVKSSFVAMTIPEAKQPFKLDFSFNKKWFFLPIGLFFLIAQAFFIMQKMVPAIAMLLFVVAVIIYFFLIKEQRVQVSLELDEMRNMLFVIVGVSLVVAGWILLLNKLNFNQNLGAFVTAAGLIVFFLGIPENRMAVEGPSQEDEILFTNNKFLDNTFVKIGLLAVVVVGVNVGNMIARNTEMNMYSMIFYAMAIAAFFFAMPIIKFREELYDNKFVNIIKLVMILVAFFLAYLGQKYFFANKVNLALTYYLGAAAIVIAFFPISTKKEQESPIPVSAEIIFVSVITLVALFLRVYQLDVRPLGIENDEAGGMVAIVKNFWVGQHPIYAYFQELMYSIFGQNRIGLRASGVILGTISIPVIYFAVRSVLGARTAIFSTVMFSFLRWNLHFGRSGHGTIMMILAESFAIYFILKSIQKRDKFNYFMAGLSSGLCWYGVLTGWFVVLTPIFYMIFESFTKQKYFKRNIIGILAFMLGFWVFGSHHIKNYFISSKTYFSRISEVSVFSKDPNAPVSNPAKGIIDNTRLVMLMFNHQGDSRQRNSGGQPYEATVDFVTAIFYGIGFLYCVYYSKYYLCFVLIMLFFSQAAGSIFSIEAPSAMRAVGTMIPAIMFAAIAFDRLSHAFLRVFKGKIFNFVVYPLVLVLALSPIITENYKQYFKRWVGGMDELATAAGMYTDKLGKDYRVYLSTGMYYPGHPPFRVFRWDYKVDCSPIPSDIFLSLTRGGDDEGFAIFFHMDTWDSEYYFAQLFSDGKTESYSHEGFGKFFDVLIMDKDQMNKYKGAKAVFRDNVTEKVVENTALSFNDTLGLTLPYTVSFKGQFYLPAYGDVFFSNKGNAETVFTINDVALKPGQAIKLGKGIHTIKLRAIKKNQSDTLMPVMSITRITGGNKSQKEVIELEKKFIFTIKRTGVKAVMYAGDDWYNSPVTDEAIMPLIYYSSRRTSDAPSMKMSGRLRIDSPGVYKFAPAGNGFIAVIIDNKYYWDNAGMKNIKTEFLGKGYVNVDTFNLSKGLKRIDIYTLNSNQLLMQWSINGAKAENMPYDALEPVN